ncbi:MAG: hypothetical protein QXN55_00930 [Candidatus Nitrosotenuis sp.]
MGRITRSARGEIVDFDILEIQQALAAAPVPVSVDQRRKFIDEKGGFSKSTPVEVAPEAEKEVVEVNQLPLALRVSAEAAVESAEASKSSKTK